MKILVNRKIKQLFLYVLLAVVAFTAASVLIICLGLKNAALYVATEDGSAGTKGNVLDAVRENRLEADAIFACGPAPMLRAIKAYAKEKGIRAWISMEERMACGVGACLACVCGSKDVDSHSHVHNKRVCKDGPVFAAEEVEI